MAFPKVKISDDSGNTVGVDTSSSALNVKLVESIDSIDIGDVSLLLGGTAADHGAGAVGDPNNTLRVTLASDDPAVVDLAAMEVLLGTIDADTGNTSGYLSNIQGAVYVDDADWVDGSNKHVLVGGLYQSSMQSVTDGDVAPFQIDYNGVLRTSHSIIGGADGVTTVSTAGTDVVLGGDVACKKIDIQAQTDNTGLIAVGFTGVDATVADGTGVILYAGDTYSLEMVNLNLIYIDSTVSGEGVRYTYFT